MKKKMKVGIIDLKINNIFSIFKAMQLAGYNTYIIGPKENLKRYNLIILPGVGSYKIAMKSIKKSNLDYKLMEYIQNHENKLFGICLGMQLFFDNSLEFGNTPGLGLLKGNVKKFDLSKTKYIPHMNWNDIKFLKLKNKIISKTLNQKYFYFVHSFYCEPENKKNILSTSKFNKQEFCSSILNQNILGTQFHPEKSGEIGISFLKNINNFYDNN
tara:strand:- start:343 stop:984 length:642 start_codon:yes stop_codon:yes gene_type:complete